MATFSQQVGQSRAKLAQLIQLGFPPWCLFPKLLLSMVGSKADFERVIMKAGKTLETYTWSLHASLLLHSVVKASHKPAQNQRERKY